MENVRDIGPKSFNNWGIKKRWIKISLISALVLFFVLLPVFHESSYTFHILSLTFIYAVAAVSLRTIIISGQFPLAHAAYMGIGAYLSGMASKWLGWSPWLTILPSALITGGLGMLIGYPFSRLRGLYYAMGSLFFGMAVILVISAGGKLTGGYSGLTSVPPLFTGPESRKIYYYFFLGLALVFITGLYRLEFCRIGTTLKAIAQSHIVASSVGINESWYRVLVLGIGCFVAGLIGATYAHYNLVLTPSSFDLMATLWLVMYVLIGGLESFAGPIVGTAILVLIPEYFRGLKIYSPYISAAILLIVVYLLRKGVVGLPQMFWSWYQKRKLNKVENVS